MQHRACFRFDLLFSCLVMVLLRFPSLQVLCQTAQGGAILIFHPRDWLGSCSCNFVSQLRAFLITAAFYYADTGNNENCSQKGQVGVAISNVVSLAGSNANALPVFSFAGR